MRKTTKEANAATEYTVENKADTRDSKRTFAVGYDATSAVYQPAMVSE